MGNKKAFNPFDYQSGSTYRAVLSDDYFGLIEEIRQKVSGDRFSFAVDVGTYFYRAVFPERTIMTAMVCASGMKNSDCLTQEENETVLEAQSFLNSPSEQSKDFPTIVCDIACGQAVVYFNEIREYCDRLDLEHLNWDYEKIQVFFSKWYAFAKKVKTSKFAWTLNNLIDDLAQQQGFDDPDRDVNRDIYDIQTPNQSVAEEIWKIIWLAGFSFGMNQPWGNRLDIPTHFRLKSFLWEKEKLYRMVQVIGWHFPNVKIKMISPLEEDLRSYHWYRNRLDISQKIRIYSRSAMLDLLKKNNFTDPWPEFRRLARLD